MTGFFPKQPRIKLTPDAYAELRQQVLERDHWRCQSCGVMTNLQVHHLEFRSSLGSDTEENLITLCSKCHSRSHGRG